MMRRILRGLVSWVLLAAASIGVVALVAFAVILFVLILAVAEALSQRSAF